MKIKCTENRRDSLPVGILQSYSCNEVIRLTIGKEYVVYALSEFYGYVWYCVMDEGCSTFPMWRSSPLFEISDPKLSRYWIYNLIEAYENPNDPKVPFFSFPEWVNDPYFYDSLTEDEKKEKEIFEKYRQVMEVEFPDRSLEKAQIGDEQWLICPFCIDAWEEPSSFNGIVMCPKCRKLWNNPRYKDELPHL